MEERHVCHVYTLERKVEEFTLNYLSCCSICNSKSLSFDESGTASKLFY